jgi:hypothetical protein
VTILQPVQQRLLFIHAQGPAHVLPFFELLYARPQFAPRVPKGARKLADFHVHGAA